MSLIMEMLYLLKKKEEDDGPTRNLKTNWFGLISKSNVNAVRNA